MGRSGPIRPHCLGGAVPVSGGRKPEVNPKQKGKHMAANSCRSCPSCLPESKSIEFFGTSFGSGVSACAQFGNVLGKPGLAEDAVDTLMEKFAASCGKFGAACPPPNKDGTPVSYPRAAVAVPDSSVHLDASGGLKEQITQDERDAMTSCMACAHFVPAKVVEDELGWPFALCAVTGRLLLNNRYRVEPKYCPRPEPGKNRVDTDGIDLLSIYADVFSFATIGVKAKAVFDPNAAASDPREYVSDDELTDADRSFGIRAWRRVVHPKNPEKSVLLPIFDPASFDEIERAKIPQMGDGSGVEFYVDWHNLLYRIGAVIMGMDKTPALIGGAGTGKTEAFQYVAWMCQMPFERISIRKTSEVDDLAGKWIFEDNTTKWIDGRFTKGWRTRSVTVVDEWNAGPDEVEQFLRPCFDNSRQLVLDSGKGGRVDRHPYAFVGLTMNPSWDVKYTGLTELSAAALNRVSTIAVDLPDEDTERAILTKFCSGNDIPLLKSDLDRVMAIAKELRQLADPMVGELPISWGIRPQLAVMAALPYFDLMECYKLACIDSLDPMSADKVIAIVKGYE